MKQILTSIVLVLFMSCGVLTSSFAETVIEAGIHAGREKISLVSETNSVIETTDSGSMFSFAIGGTKRYTDTIEGQFSFGIKSDANFTANNEASWVRYPLNTLLFYRTEKYRLGIGATVHFSPTFKVSGTTKNASNNYKDALGGLLEIDFRINQQFHWGLRYTSIKYVNERDNTSVNGSSIGLLIIAII